MEKSIAEKALSLNLTRPLYGTIAEIGAGQEVARWFFKVGGAAGTIAKAMSAYDMKFSDDIYGKEQSGRYVVKSRVLRMLDHEYSLLQSRLTEENNEKFFFAFANTVAAKSYKYQGDCHGWMGLRFQHKPNDPPSQVTLHVRMLDPGNPQQQETLGILGVNLIYACYNYHLDFDQFLISLMDGDLKHRMEINTIQLEGSVFENPDSGLLHLKLVEHGLTPVVLLPKSGETSHIGEELYEKQLIIHPGNFDPPLQTDLDILRSARNHYCSSKDHDLCDPYLVSEIRFHHKQTNTKDILHRVELLQNHEQNVMISDFDHIYKLTEFVARFTDNHINVVFRATKIIEIFENKDLTSLDRLSRIFNERTRVYIYPVKADKVPTQNRKDPSKKIFGLSDYKASNPNHYLYKYLITSGYIQELTGFDQDLV